MASKLAFLCLILPGLLVASTAVAHPDGIYYQIAFMWPGAYCAQTSRGCCMPATDDVPASDFYISAFTVYNSTTNAAKEHCSNDPFSLNKILDVQGLNKYWSSIKCPSNNGQKSWKRSWTTSGVCSGFNESSYFNTALSLRDRFNPLARLAANGIKPDFNLYSVKGIKTVIRKQIGVTPVIQCSKGPFDKFQLYQIYVCVSEDKTFIDCPAPQNFTCSSEILFHPFKKWMLKKQSTAPLYEADPFELLGVAVDH